MQDTVVVINPKDNVGVVIREKKKGEQVFRDTGDPIVLLDDIPKNHKIALEQIPRNSPVIKYGENIGYAKETIPAGRWVHTHNLKASAGD